jgi:hypothetical protein
VSNSPNNLKQDAKTAAQDASSSFSDSEAGPIDHCGTTIHPNERLPDKPLEKMEVEIKYNDGITIRGTRDFVERTKAHLDQISRTRSGKKLLKSIAKSGKKTRIVQATGGNSTHYTNNQGVIKKDKVVEWTDEDSGCKEKLTGTGEGSNSIIEYNDSVTEVGTEEEWQKRPPAIGLAHELVHADDAAYGRTDPDSKNGEGNWERRAVGLSPYEKSDYSENKIRSEWDPKQPQRTKSINEGQKHVAPWTS